MRVKELEQQLSIFLDMRATENEAIFTTSSEIDGARFDFNAQPVESPPTQTGTTMQQQTMSKFSACQHTPNTHKSDSLANELKLLSLEAAADRHVGSSSGISFAKLTQAVLRRLSPDRREFVFEDGLNDDQEDEEEEDIFPNENESTPTFTSAFAEINTHLVSSPPLPLHYPLSASTQQEDPSSLHESLSLIDPSHISHLLEFYFAHSHTLYPIVQQHELTNVLWRLYADASDPLTQSALWQFRIWMVLAIGSTAYSSVSLLDESESVQLFNKAMVHFEAAMGCGDLVSFFYLEMESMTE